MDFQMLKKYLDQANVEDAAKFLEELYISNPQHFKKSLLLSNSLPDPIKNPISKNKLGIITKSFVKAGINLVDKSVDISRFVEDFNEITSAIRVLNQNVTSNLEKLENNSFLEYSFSQQLQMFCIYLEDQNRMISEQNENQSGFYTGMESQIAKYEAEGVKDIKISQADNLEGLLEIANTLFKYLNYKKNPEVEKDFNHDNISPYGIPSFKDIMLLAQQRNMLSDIWVKFKFREWNLKQVKRNDTIINLFEPASKEDYLKERIAVDRYTYRDHINFQKIDLKYKKENRKSAKYMDTIAKNLSDSAQVFNLDKNSFNRSKQVIKNIVNSQLESLDDIYLELEHEGLTITHLIMGFEYLYTISLVYRYSTLSKFEENEISNYKKLSPIIDKATLVNQFAYLYEIDTNTAELVINTFIFSKTYTPDVFSQPLIAVNEEKIIFCPTLIIQMNIVRIIEMLAKEWKKKISNKGIKFEKDLRFILSFNPFIEVNTKKIEFLAYDGIDVEFDFIAKFEDQILLIEFKHVKRPFDDKMHRTALQTLDVGIKQVNRRENVLINDWSTIKEKCSFNLPDTPPPKENIIKLVCTNILDYTSVIRSGIEIIDSSSLLKFFMSPEVTVYSNGDIVSGVPYTNLWEDGAPTIEEFKKFLANPVAIQPYKDCYKAVFKPIQKTSDDDNYISFLDYSLIKDPYLEIGNNISKTNKGVKIGRNDMCPCGSKMKYKKCCGK